MPVILVAAMLTTAIPSRADTIIDDWESVKAPPAPTLMPVMLDPKTTALVLIDIVKQTCNEEKRPRCVAAVPKIHKLLSEARAASVYVVYTLFPSPSPATFPNPEISDYVPALAPAGNEPVVTAFVDKFTLGGKSTGLQAMLKDKGIKNLIVVGVASHNGVLFTSVAAALRGFHVVVHVDGMAGNNAYEDQATDYILTSSIVFKVTLTRIDLITFSH
ncbi:hypothetical protein WM40_16725 [Robbsia andropogonis]|uniref:Isochorismatase-like domain-containing protein n=1 Tax=Robbsia andropogonis TaxID=28092 RepID=A0A0F5JY20_9BURK|nr:isochorismatase family protein [Robbsia andropogonis]KKB62580.1 hypothetical protein WM40_16725 [Robbsia andropogonis]